MISLSTGFQPLFWMGYPLLPGDSEAGRKLEEDAGKRELRAAFHRKAESLIGTPYKYGVAPQCQLGTDCNGVVYFSIFSDIRQRLSSQGYYQFAQKKNAVIDAGATPQESDLFFKGPNSSINHTGIVEGCTRTADGDMTCKLIHANGTPEKDAQGKAIIGSCVESPPEVTCEVTRKEVNLRLVEGQWRSLRKSGPTENVYRFADTPLLVEARSDNRTGIDLSLPFTPSADELGIGPLKSAIYDSTSGMLTLIGEKKSGTTAGINPIYILDLLASLERTGGESPYFNLIPTPESAATVSHLMEKSGPPIRPPRSYKIYLGREAWKWGGFAEEGPDDLTLQPVFSDPQLAYTQTGRIMFEADLFLKKSIWEGPETVLKYAEWIESQGITEARTATSALWFGSDSDSAGVTRYSDDHKQILEIAEIKVRTYCDPHRNLREAMNNVNKPALELSCPQESRIGFHSRYIQANYESLSGEYPVLVQLKELYKALLVAKVLYTKGIKSEELGYAPSLERLVPTESKVKPAFVANSTNGLFSAIGGVGGVVLQPDYSIRDGNVQESPLYGFYQTSTAASVPMMDISNSGIPHQEFRAVQFLVRSHVSPPQVDYFRTSLGIFFQYLLPALTVTLVGAWLFGRPRWQGAIHGIGLGVLSEVFTEAIEEPLWAIGATEVFGIMACLQRRMPFFGGAALSLLAGTSAVAGKTIRQYLNKKEA